MPKKANNPQNLIPCKKGEIRNPTGKKKGTRNWTTVVREILQTRKDDMDKKPQGQLLGVELLANAAFRRAVNKGGHDLMEILNRIEGKVTDKTDLVSSDRSMSPCVIVKLPKKDL